MKAATIVATLIGVITLVFFIGFEIVKYTDSQGEDIEKRESRTKELEDTFRKKQEDLEEEYNKKINELTNKFNEQDIQNEVKEEVQDTEKLFNEKIEKQNEELEKMIQLNSGLEQDVKAKTDTINMLLSEKQALLDKILEQDNIIAQKDSLIAFYKSEITLLRTQSREALEILREATKAETEGDNFIGFWNKNKKQEKYYTAWQLYRRLYSEYGIGTAEESFHAVWGKLQKLGVKLEY